jgi:hypothetical protein
MRGRLVMVMTVVLCVVLGRSAWALWIEDSGHVGVITRPLVINPATGSADSSRTAAPLPSGESVLPGDPARSGLIPAPGAIGSPVSTSLPAGPAPSATSSPGVTSTPDEEVPQTVPRDVESVDDSGWDRPSDDHHDDGDHDDR